ncbi:MAG: VWA domain-containing protein [Bacteroidota bacterium]
MKKGRMLSLWVAALAATVALAMPACAGKTSAKSGVTLYGALNCPYVSTEGGRVYLQLSVAAPEITRPERRPMNLAVVLDRSGSMGAEGKMENAKAAVRALINQLRPEDYVSIVIYDDVVEVLRNSARVRDKAALRRLVDEIYPRGWTNLGGGMIEGFRQAEMNAREGFVNRVVLLSDGLANRGITSPRRLREIARDYRSEAITLTTIGVGWEFNENLMVGLSESGGGNYYFLESPRDLASVFQKEFDLITELVAANVVIELELNATVRVTDVIGYEYSAEKDRCAIHVGDLYGSESREITVELTVPPGRGSRKLLTAAFSRSSRSRLGNPTYAAVVEYTVESEEIEEHRDMAVQADADVAVSTRLVDRAMDALDEGKEEEAAEALRDARKQLGASPAASVAGAAGEEIKEQQGRLEEYERELKKGKDKAKKSIQYDNYRTKKKK